VTAVSTGDPVAAEAGRRDAQGAGSRLGPIPLIAFSTGVGLLLCSVADALSRATLTPSPVIYWAGFLIIVAPIAYRLLLPQPSAGERLALVCMLVMAIYCVKILREPFTFTIPDELQHSFNIVQISDHHHLFHRNPILPISADYPGLEGATSALSSTTGMSGFAAAMVLIGAARLTLAAGLFVLFARISGSARLAGLGAALYAANFNFLIFGAQFSYESLALPLLVVILMALAERSGGERRLSRAWAVPITLLTAAVVVTHHLTAYILIICLLVLSLLYWLRQRKFEWSNPWPFLVLAVALTAGWLVFVASKTVGYLSPLLTDAFTATLHVLTGQETARGVFTPAGVKAGTVAAGPTPIIARVIALASVFILFAAMPFGLRELWRGWRRRLPDPFVVVMSLAGVGFFVVLGLRLAPAAWETGNRAGEFLFIGVGFVAAVASLLVYSRFVERSPHRRPWLRQAALAVGVAGVVMGGAFSGWPWDAELPGTLTAKAQGRTIESEPLGLANWARTHLAGGKFAAPDAVARLLLYPGRERALAPGTTYQLKGVFDERVLAPWQPPLLRHYRFDYAVADRRLASEDTTRGYYFALRPPAGHGERLHPNGVITKFEGIPTATRVFDSGNLVVYDLKGRP
jgi:hypothetical protein